VRVGQILSHQRGGQNLGVLPEFGQSGRPTVSRGSLVLNCDSSDRCSLRLEITLSPSTLNLHPRSVAVDYITDPKFGSRLATSADVKRSTKSPTRKNKRSECSPKFWRVGSWTGDLEATVKKNLIPAGSPAESLKLSAVAPAVRETHFGADFATGVRRGLCAHNSSDVCDRLDLTCKGGNHN